MREAPELVINKDETDLGMVGDLAHGSTVGDDEDPSLAHADAEAVEFADDAMNRGSGHGINIQKSERLASVKSQSSGSASVKIVC